MRWLWIWKSESEVAQSSLTLCDPMDCSLSGSSVHEIFQARVLEWVAISFSRRSSRPRDWTQVSSIVGSRFTVWTTREVFFRVPASISRRWEQKDKQSLYNWNFEMIIIMRWLWMYPMLTALNPSHEAPSIPLPLALSLSLSPAKVQWMFPPTFSKTFLVFMLKNYISRSSFLSPQQTKMFGHLTLEINIYFLFSSVTQLCLSLRSHGLQHTRFPCPSSIPRACSNSCPSSPWCHPTISSYVVPFSWLQSCPASGSFPMSQFLTSGGHTIGVSASASVSPSNDHSGLISFRIDWFDLLAVQGTPKSLLKHHSWKVSILHHSAFFIV